MKLYNDFIGSDEHNIELNFFGGDYEPQFLENKKKMPEDWYYNNVDITYSFNNRGHRCKNFEDIDQDNYILFTGCSHTMGVGLELEKSYPYLLSKELNMDYYNLGIPATGMDVVEYNLLNWYLTIPKKPKLLVIQWPDHSRFMEYDLERDHIMPRGTWDHTEQKYRSFIVNAEDSGLVYAKKYMSTTLIKTVTKETPTINCNYGKEHHYGADNLYFPTTDKARDLGHAGMKSHANFVEILLHYVEVKGFLK